MNQTKQDLFSIAINICTSFLHLNNISIPRYMNRNISSHGFFNPPNIIIVNLKNARTPTKTPGFCWSYPGYKADLTPIGITAHEIGHYLQYIFNITNRQITSLTIDEPSVSSYEPNAGEILSESTKLFINNPNLLKLGRPKRYSLLCDALHLRPLHDKPWQTILSNAHPKFIIAATKWIKHGQSS